MRTDAKQCNLCRNRCEWMRCQCDIDSISMKFAANRCNIGARSMRTVVSSMRTDMGSCDVVEIQVQIDAKRCVIGPKPMRVDAILYQVDTNLINIGSDPCASRCEIGASVRVGSMGSSVLVVSWYCSFLMMVRWCPSGVPVLFQCVPAVPR